MSVIQSLQLLWFINKQKPNSQQIFWEVVKWTKNKSSQNLVLQYPTSLKTQTKEKPSLICSKEFFVNKKSQMANSKSEKEGRNWLKLAPIQNLSAICRKSNWELQNVKKKEVKTDYDDDDIYLQKFNKGWFVERTTPPPCLLHSSPHPFHHHLLKTELNSKSHPLTWSLNRTSLKLLNFDWKSINIGWT